mmetsp:Transcript_34443/g.97873  ORF Transcript_34443/g.97873 Transcript_34443/m.97873 type:complete len:221 (+) Transcript_34443:944-1606(+)
MVIGRGPLGRVAALHSRRRPRVAADPDVDVWVAASSPGDEGPIAVAEARGALRCDPDDPFEVLRAELPCRVIVHEGYHDRVGQQHSGGDDRVDRSTDSAPQDRQLRDLPGPGELVLQLRRVHEVYAHAANQGQVAEQGPHLRHQATRGHAVVHAERHACHRHVDLEAARTIESYHHLDAVRDLLATDGLYAWRLAVAKVDVQHFHFGPEPKGQLLGDGRR